jgi:SAM-dependent methyltransferase
LNVLQGGIEQFNNDESLFDVITLSHVIEHLHDPVKVLKACHRLLKPTGRLWLETPNIDSLGHRQYMENWRGLEPPRHLVLFNRQSLAQALLGTGFARIESRPIPSPLAWLSKQSEAIKQGLPVEGDIQLSVTRKWMVKKDILLQTILPSRKEFLTTIAFKSIV